MNWGGPAEFFAMGGYASYVWGSFGVCAIAVVIETILLNRRRTNLLQQLKTESSGNP